MRILDLREDQLPYDLDEARSVLAEEIAHPSRVVMIVRGSGPEISRFCDRAAGRSEPFPFREVVWVIDRRIFLPGQEDELFEGEVEWCAVALDLDDAPSVWLAPHATTRQIERAFLEAQAGGA